MFAQYAHTLRYTGPATDSTVDPETGYLVPGTAGQLTEQSCRYENVRDAKEIRGVDNNTYQQTGTIYLPKDAAYVPAEGTEVEVVGYFQGLVTKPYIGRFNISIRV